MPAACKGEDWSRGRGEAAGAQPPLPGGGGWGEVGAAWRQTPGQGAEYCECEQGLLQANQLFVWQGTLTAVALISLRGTALWKTFRNIGLIGCWEWHGIPSVD